MVALKIVGKYFIFPLRSFNDMIIIILEEYAE